MRSRRRSPKGGVLAEKQQRYVQLIEQGINNTQPCRVVGINRKTGNRWRYGRSILNSAGERVHYPPVKIEERRPRNPRYLSEDERVMIADLLAVSDGVRAIGRTLGRAASTISREIRRNRDMTRTSGIARTMPSRPPEPHVPHWGQCKRPFLRAKVRETPGGGLRTWVCPGQPGVTWLTALAEPRSSRRPRGPPTLNTGI